MPATRAKQRLARVVREQHALTSATVERKNALAENARQKDRQSGLRLGFWYPDRASK